MINIDEITAKKNIGEIVRSMGFPKNNYIFVNNKVVTQEIMLYCRNRIVTLFVKIKKDGKLKKFCFKQSRHLIVHSFFYHLIVSRIVMNEYGTEDFENLKYNDKNKRISFFGNCGYRSFKISKKDIYGYEQEEEISRIKKFINTIRRND